MCPDFPHFLIFKKVNVYDMLWKFTEINQNVSTTSISTFTKSVVVKFLSTGKLWKKLTFIAFSKVNLYDLFWAKM